MTNHKGNFSMLVVILIILGLVYVTFTAVTSQIDGTSPANNCTASTTASVTGIIPSLVIIVSIILGITFFSWYVSNAQRYQIVNVHIRKILDFLDLTTHYFAYGLFAVAIFGTLGLSVYLIYRLTSIPGVGEASSQLGLYILLIIGAYFAIAGIGYLFKTKLWDKYKQRKSESDT